jgi:dolichol kinase
LFYAPVLVLAISDPLATLVGMTWKLQAVFPNNKTLQGSLVFLLSGFLEPDCRQYLVCR